jgi:hypothetical protein
VQHTFQHQDGGDPNEVAFPERSVKPDDLIVVAIATAQMPVLAVTDDSQDEYKPTKDVEASPPPPDQRQHIHVELWYAIGKGGALKVKVSFGSSPALTPPDSEVGIYEYAPDDSGRRISLEKSVAATGFDPRPDAGAAKLATDIGGDKLYFVAGGDGGPAPGTGRGNTLVTAGTGFTLLEQQDEPDFVRFYTDERIAGDGGNADFAITYSSNWAVIGAVFSTQ